MNNTNILNDNFGLREFFTGIYKWMVVGVVVSGIFAYIGINTTYFNFIYENNIYFYGLIGIELILVLAVQFLIHKISPQVAGIIYFIYAGITGILSSGFLAMYNMNSILIIFSGAALIYGVLAYIGYNTKSDISGWRTFLLVGMIAVIFGSVVNMFLQNSMFDLLITVASLLVFSAFTVYDQQFYKNLYENIRNSEEDIERYTILGALHMYINFVVIFQDLLKLLGWNND